MALQRLDATVLMAAADPEKRTLILYILDFGCFVPAGVDCMHLLWRCLSPLTKQTPETTSNGTVHVFFSEFNMENAVDIHQSSMGGFNCQCLNGLACGENCKPVLFG